MSGVLWGSQASVPMKITLRQMIQRHWGLWYNRVVTAVHAGRSAACPPAGKGECPCRPTDPSPI